MEYSHPHPLLQPTLWHTFREKLHCNWEVLAFLDCADELEQAVNTVGALPLMNMKMLLYGK